MDREIVERLVVRILALAQDCDDLPVRDELMRIANDLSEIIEGGEMPHEARR